MLRSTAWTVALAATVTLCATVSACSTREATDPEGSDPDRDAGSGGESDAGSGSGATPARDAGSNGADAAPAECNGGGASGAVCSSSVTAFVPCLTGSALLSPSVSFTRDVQPLLGSCGAAGSACHGSANNSPSSGLFFLGLPDGGAPAGAILANIVSQPSPEDPKMNLVEPGDPASSFLMHKLDGDQCVLAADCDDADNPAFASCGAQMPFNGTALTPDQRDVIRRWIAQGAQDD